MRQIVGHRRPSKLNLNKVISSRTTTNTTMQTNQHQHQLFKKRKRFRSAFTTEQIHYLEQQYKIFPYIKIEQRKEIADFLKIEERSVKIWFQNRRMKEKREYNNETAVNPQNIGKDHFYNMPAVPLTNGQCSYSLPILLSTADTITKINIDMKEANSVEHKEKPTAKHEHNTKLNEPKASHIKANYYKEASNEEHYSPYFHQQPTKNSLQTASLPFTINKKNENKQSQQHKSNGSAEFSINLCKKYELGSVANSTAVLGNIKEKKPKNLESKPAKDTHHCTYPQGSTSKKPKISQPPPLQQPAQLNLNNPTYYPAVVPTVYGPPFVSPGNVFWKPVNFMPVMATSATPMAISTPQPQAHEKCKCCKCNCHGSTQQAQPITATLPTELQNPCAQYVIAVPYQHTSPKF